MTPNQYSKPYRFGSGVFDIADLARTQRQERSAAKFSMKTTFEDTHINEDNHINMVRLLALYDVLF
jgi:hypothetical protein